MQTDAPERSASQGGLGLANRPSLGLQLDVLVVGEWYAYRMIAKGIIPAARLGGRIVIPRAALMKMLEMEVQLPPQAYRARKSTPKKKSAARTDNPSGAREADRATDRSRI